MMQSNVSMKKWQYWAILPVVLLCFTLFSCENYTVQKTVYPAIPANLVGEKIDTVFMFDSETKTETIKYVKSEDKEGATEGENIKSEEQRTGIDTIVIFDPADYSETMIVVNHDTGVTDTIQ